MNRRPDLPQVLIPVDLAREADFSIGNIEVCPSRRQVSVGGKQETLQPRVMQVLVALARAKGAVLSREELIESCWDGIVVGDDAINRCIAKVRQIADLGDETAFQIETIPRVGYRLKPIDSPSSPTPLEHVSVAKVATAAAAPLGVALRERVAIVCAAVVLLCLILAGAFLLLKPAAASHWVVVRSEVPIATSLIEGHPAISPDGKMIAYSAGPNILTRKIYLRRIAGGDPLKLTNDGYDDVSPSWSPDGGQIAYVAFQEGQPCRIMMVPALTGEAHEVARCGFDQRSHLVWSASGNELFFLDRPDGRTPDRIVRLDLSTGRRVPLSHLADPNTVEEEPAVSPDGRWITFCRDRGDLADQRIVRNLRSQAEQVLPCEEGAWDQSATWSEDSKTIFVTTMEGADYALWTYPIDGSAPSRILSSPISMERMASGPNGLLAVAISRIDDGLARPPDRGSDKPQFLETENGVVFAPDISPNGTVAVAMKRPDGAGIWIFPRTGAPRKFMALDPDTAPFADPRWSPDGTRLATTVNARQLRVLTAAGDIVAAVHFAGRQLGDPAWTADCRSLIFPGLTEKDGWRLWRVDLDHPERLVPLQQRGWMSIRARGNELYGIRENTSGVWRIDGTPRKITGQPAPDLAALWTIAGDEIAYGDGGAGQPRRIMGQPIAGGPPHLMASVSGYSWDDGFAYDPLSRSIVYVAILRHDSDIELLHLAKE